MGEQRRLTLAVTGAGGTRMARYVLSALTEGLTAPMVSGGHPAWGMVVVPFIGLGRTDHHAWTGAQTPARRDRGR
ncbi:hypothetical protein [Actinoallomurus acaciae]|uniref:Uncharacterized protein n=1 Tax=Actinoallomurus acaciae TaxID=502577 RepID=A0ABV5YJG6_9ACTN